MRAGNVCIAAATLLFMIGTSKCERKEIIVIGGGIAGLAAAREIRNNRSGDYQVVVYEARRDRYGGRVWTNKRKMSNSRGVEADLGAMALNTEASSNPLLNLTEKFELKTVKLGPLQLFLPKLNKRISGTELAEAFVKARKLYEAAVGGVKSLSDDASVGSVVSKVAAALKSQGQAEDELVMSVLDFFATLKMPDLSAKLYQASMVDFGYNVLLEDGMGELVDRLASGADDEIPVFVDLRKPVRQVKVDPKRKKVLVRLKDGSQAQADAVIVAVPVTHIRDNKILFEPALPDNYRKAFQTLGTAVSNRLIVEFDELFWPDEFGVFLHKVDEDDENAGLFTKWLNMHQLVGRPVLMTTFGGPAALKFENMTDDEVKALVKDRLSALFGSAAEKREIVQLLRSNWASSEHFGLAFSYPKVGTDASIWDTMSDPLCPYIYFAGEHTIQKGIGSLHGAYNSGVRAAKQLMSGLCEEREREEKRRKQKEKKEKEKKIKKESDDKSKKEKVEEQEKDEL